MNQSQEARMHGLTHARTHALINGQPENIMSPPIPIGGGGIESIYDAIYLTVVRCQDFQAFRSGKAP